MSKAYDSVHIPLLKKVLNWLKVLNTITNLITDIFSDRSNTVITYLGLTEPYKVYDGIDQGETITPLLWWIYYDPLLCRITKSYKGYTLQTNILNQNTNINTSVSANFPTLAFIDDTIWLAESKNQLEEIITTATSFFSLANITVNPTKSVLAAITKSIDPQIIFNHTIIKGLHNNQAFRFLGCWFSLTKKHTLSYKIILEEANNALNLLYKAKITDKQAIYIINSVILARIAYWIQNTFLSESLCNKITQWYTTLAKHKAGLAKSVPNSTIYHYNIYSLCIVQDIQIQQQVAILTRYLNHPQFHLLALKIRL